MRRPDKYGSSLVGRLSDAGWVRSGLLPGGRVRSICQPTSTEVMTRTEAGPGFEEPLVGTRSVWPSVLSLPGSLPSGWLFSSSIEVR